MAAGRGDFQRASCVQLSTHVGEIGNVAGVGLRRIGRGRGQRIHAAQVRADFRQCVRDAHVHVAQQRRFVRIARGHDHAMVQARR